MFNNLFKPYFLKHKIFFFGNFWLDKNLLSLTYTRVDLYASMYGLQQVDDMSLNEEEITFNTRTFYSKYASNPKIDQQ